MAEEHSRLARPPISSGDPNGADVDAPNELLEEIDTFEEIEVESAMQTGEHRRPLRTSVPPPVPAHARQSQRPTVLPPPRANEGGSEKLGGSPASRPPSHSGMFRIDRPEEGHAGPSPYVSLPPPPPPARVSAPPPLPAAGAPDLGELKRQLAALTKESGEQTAQTHRLRLMVRLREDRVRELETEVAAQRARVAALEQQLAGLRAQRAADDLKRISGIGPGFERALHAIGISTFRQIAEWTPAEIDRVAREIRSTPRRIARDQWVERARELIAGEARTSEAEATPSTQT